MYKVYDYYEGGKQLVGEFKSYHAMREFKAEYYKDTDGECDLVVEYEEGEEEWKN